MADATRSAPSENLEFARLFERLSEQVLAGEHIDLELLTQDYPQYGGKLAELLPTLRAMASMGAAEPLRGELPVEAGRERILGDFRILREVGRGGMGVVYEAEQISLSRRVALKILPFAAVLDERQLARFKNEALAAALLEHPHIVPVYAVGCERGIHFYAMRFIEGQTLAEAFRRDDPAGSAEQTQVAGTLRVPNAGTAPTGQSGSVHQTRSYPIRQSALGECGLHAAADGRAENVAGSAQVDWSAQRTLRADARPVADLSTQLVPANPAWWRRLADLGIQAAEALDHAHQHGIVHRDVKPGNLLLDAKGQLWVTDFGLAQVSGSAELTMTGDMLGTLRYMSPEQARGERILDQRTDVYSLGVTLYELIARQPVFAARDRQLLLRSVAEEEPKPLRQIVSSIPRDLDTIVHKAMAKDRDDRFPSAAAFADDLRRFIDNLPIQARPPGVWQRVRKWGRRHQSLIAVGLAGFILAGIVGSWLVWQERNETAAAWEQERRQRVDAQANLDLALVALENIYGKFLSGHMAVRPDLRDLQMELVRDSVEFYAQIALANRTNPATMPKAARALIMVAQLNEKFGDQQVAEDAYEQCLAIWQELVARHPKNAEYLRELATTNCQFGLWLKDRGRESEAFPAFREAVAQFTRLRTQFRRPFDDKGQEEAAWCNLAQALGGGGQWAEAEQAYLTVNALMVAHLEQWPQAFDTRAHLAQHLRHLANWRAQQKDMVAAVQYLQQAIEQGERAVSASPRTADLRVELTWIYRDLIKIRAQEGRSAAAEPVVVKFRELAKAMKEDFPGVPEYQMLWRQLEPLKQAAPSEPAKPTEATEQRTGSDTS